MGVFCVCFWCCPSSLCGFGFVVCCFLGFAFGGWGWFFCCGGVFVGFLFVGWVLGVLFFGGCLGGVVFVGYVCGVLFFVFLLWSVVVVVVGRGVLESGVGVGGLGAGLLSGGLSGSVCSVFVPGGVGVDVLSGGLSGLLGAVGRVGVFGGSLRGGVGGAGDDGLMGVGVSVGWGSSGVADGSGGFAGVGVGGGFIEGFWGGGEGFSEPTTDGVAIGVPSTGLEVASEGVLSVGGTVLPPAGFEAIEGASMGSGLFGVVGGRGVRFGSSSGFGGSVAGGVDGLLAVLGCSPVGLFPVSGV